MTEHLSDLALDALRLGQGAGAARAHLTTCATCRAREQALAQEAAAFAARFEPAGLATEALARAEAPRGAARWLRRWPALSGALAMVAVLYVAVPREPAVRAKGGPAPLVELFTLSGDERTPVAGPVSARAHLAVRVTPTGPSHVRILWSSAPDRWDALYPERDAAAWGIDGARWLDREVVLDGAPEPESLGVVACPRAIDHAAAAAMLRGEARDGCAVERVAVVKR